MTPEKKIVSLEEFLQMDKENEHRLEYFDGEVVYLEPPSVKHQQVLLNVNAAALCPAVDVVNCPYIDGIGVHM